MAVRHADEDMQNAPLHVLDETMENVNMWCKKLPLNNNAESWKLHSPNIMCAHQCMNFERQEYMKHRLNYETMSTNKVV